MSRLVATRPWRRASARCALLAAISLLVMLGGCAVGPDYERPQVDLPTEWTVVGDDDIAPTPRLTRWWERFDDPLLTELIEEAASQNLSLQVAGLRILAARAALNVAAGNRFPQRQAVRGDVLRTSVSENTANLPPGLDDGYWEGTFGAEIAWELDFWGKFRRNVEGAQAGLASTVAAYDAALVTLLADTARAYFTVRTLQSLLRVTRANVALQERSLEISEVLARNERTTELDVAQARTLLESTRADIPQLEARLIQARNALSFLLGQPPGELETRLGTGPIPTPPAQIEVGLPADLLRQRPDVLQAEFEAAAQSARVGVAVANRYPAFSLVGFVGLRAADAGAGSIGSLADADSVQALAGPGFTVPLLNYGRLKNAVLQEDARLQQALVSYQNTVLNAAREVEDAIAGFASEREALAALTRSATAAERAVDLALLQYREGVATYQRVLDTQRTLNLQQRLAVSSEGDVVDRLVLLYRALGGGWQIRQGQPVVDQRYLDLMRARVGWGQRLDSDAVATPAGAPSLPAPASTQPVLGPVAP